MPPTERPNVILFFTDQQRWDTTGVHGNPLELTPNFDRMATHGTHLANFFTCQPVCAPARSCLQTGQYATTTGVFRNGIALAPDAVTLARVFGAAGYATGYIGKCHLAGRGQGQAVPPDQRGGYQEWLAANALEMCSDAYRTVLYDEAGEEVRLPGYRVDALTDAAIRYVDRHRADPFLLCLSFLEPHHQNSVDDYPPPEGYRERYTGRWVPPDLQALGGSSARHLGGYFGMVRRLDEALGRLRDALRSLELDRRTIVVFLSDHGNHFKTRNGEYKRSCHESSIRVPSAICGPGFEGGGRVRQLISLVDIAPTLIEAAGLPVPDGVQGRSLLPLLRGAGTPWPEEVFVQISESQVGRAVRTHRWKYGVTAPGVQGGEAPGAASYVEQYLYDLDSDPYELNNLAGRGSHRGVADRMRERLLRRMAEAGEPPAEVLPPENRPPGAP